MAGVGRRIFFDELGVVHFDSGECTDGIPHKTINGGLDLIELPYGSYADEFSRVLRWHIDPISKLPVFDELSDVPISDSEYIEELEEALLSQEGVW